MEYKTLKDGRRALYYSPYKAQQERARIERKNNIKEIARALAYMAGAVIFTYSAYWILCMFLYVYGA